MSADSVDDLVQRALDLLEQAAAMGSGKSRRACSVLHGGEAAHAEIDDTVPLARVEALTAEGRGREAIGIVAGDDQAMARRLRRKREKRNGRQGLSAERTDD
ncbi:MAG: hypothetical protein AB7S71_01440 [Dongiaceae bacterium]